MGKLDGSCLCGNVTYTCDADPIASANCHCTDCQKTSGAAFSTNVLVPADSFSISGETLAVYETAGTDHGLTAKRHFCSNCGSTLVTISDGYPGLAIIKAGSLDDSSLVQPVMDAWGDSKQSWVDTGERMVLARDPAPEVLAQLAG
jgi:hypothetical protein